MSSLPTGGHRPNKLFYIDNIKVLLTILVILHHTVITYGGVGGWYYVQKSSLQGALIPMVMFVSINQSFFMGFFFLLAAYFTVPSYDRKGAGRFLGDRLLRLGVPLVFYSLVLSPLYSYLVYYFAKEQHITFWEYLSGYNSWISFGVMWFVAALLDFTLLYVAGRAVFKIKFNKAVPVPGTVAILVFAVAIGVISFFVRIIFPVGWVLDPVGFQLGHFSQYIALFVVGVLAYRNNWFEQLSDRTGKQLTLSAWLCLLFFPVFYIIRVKFDMPIEWYSGGFHWQSLLYAVWEQWIGLSILTALLVRGRRSWNVSSGLLGRLSRAAFAVYMIHPLAVISLSLAMRNVGIEPAVKFLLVAPLAVLGSFLLGGVIVRVPGVRRFV